MMMGKRTAACLATLALLLLAWPQGSAAEAPGGTVAAVPKHSCTAEWGDSCSNCHCDKNAGLNCQCRWQNGQKVCKCGCRYKNFYWCEYLGYCLPWWARDLCNSFYDCQCEYELTDYCQTRIEESCSDCTSVCAYSDYWCWSDACASCLSDNCQSVYDDCYQLPK